MLKKILAFTMSEVLMVVAIIGVTAALTLPTMTSNLDEKKVVSKVRKIYGEIDTAYQAIVAQEGKPIEWKDIDNGADQDKMTKLFTKKIAERLAINQKNDAKSLFLKDGSYLEFNVTDRPSIIAELTKEENSCTGRMGTITLDIDGPQKGFKNVGKDIFVFNICYVEGIVPDGSSDSGPVVSANGSNTAWVIKAGNMDYLKCASQLNWNTKKTCK